jgi:arylformamidase
MKIFDISVPLNEKLPTFPGDPGIELEVIYSLEKGDNANVTMLRFGAHTGTHVDAPVHFIAGASKVEAMPLDVLIGPARVVEISHDVDGITAEHILAAKLKGTKRVLFKTRNSEFWSNLSEGFRTDFTYIASDAARALLDLDVRLVGIDYLSVEKYQSGSYETHLSLLGNGVVIVEGLNLRAVSPGEYELICLPLKLAGGAGDGAPARAVLRDL